MFLKLTSLVVLIFALGTTCLVHSQTTYTKWNNGIDKGTWDIGLEIQDAKKMLALWDSIGEDLQTERNSLAGTYFKGGYDAGYFLRWSINKGFVLIPYFDENLITDYSYGNVTFVDSSKIIFNPEKDLKGGRSVAKTPREWTAIWEYLVPVESLRDFAQFSAGLGVYNEFNGQCCEFAPNFLCIKIDFKDKLPFYNVPAKYAHFIKSPIEGTITFVGRTRRVKSWFYEGKLYSQSMDNVILIPVKVDFQRDLRVKKNTLFHVVGQPDFVQYLQIIRVGSRAATGYVVRDVAGKDAYHDYETDQDKPLPPIRVGMKVTTRRLTH